MQLRVLLQRVLEIEQRAAMFAGRDRGARAFDARLGTHEVVAGREAENRREERDAQEVLGVGHEGGTGQAAFVNSSSARRASLQSGAAHGARSAITSARGAPMRDLSP